MGCQQSALRVASTALDHHVLNVADVLDDFVGCALQELEMQAPLIASVDADMEVISRIRIHRNFLSPAALRAMSSTLSYYVSSERMHQIVGACRRIHSMLGAPIRLWVFTSRR